MTPVKVKYIIHEQAEEQIQFDNNMREITAGTITINEYRQERGRDSVEWGETPTTQHDDSFGNEGNDNDDDNNSNNSSSSSNSSSGNDSSKSDNSGRAGSKKTDEPKPKAKEQKAFVKTVMKLMQVKMLLKKVKITHSSMKR